MKRYLLMILAALIALTGCMGLPSSGGVQEGLERAPEPEGIVFLAPDPLPGGGVEEIVSGFLDAATAGVADRYETAQKYLTDRARRSWAPGAGITVYAGGTPPRVAELQPGTVAVTVAVAGHVDHTGQYVEEASGSERTFTFELTVVEGQWRIDRLDDGVLISEVNFGTQFRQLTLNFPSPDQQFLVPDPRWFPEQNTASFAVNALLHGPSEWLAPGVQNLIPHGTTSRPVNVSEGVAEIELSSQALQAGPQERSMIVSQLDSSLTELSMLRKVHVSVDGVEYINPGQEPLQFLTPAVGHYPVILTNEHLLEVNAGGSEVVDGVTVQDVDYTALAVPYQEESMQHLPAVVRVGKKKIQTLPRGSAEIENLFEGEHLLAPSFDPYGWVWSGEQKNDGTLVATTPYSEVVAVVDAPGLRDHDVQAIRISRDGARIAIIQTVDTHPEIHVATIQRDSEGTPISIAQGRQIGRGIDQPSQLTWMDESNLAVLGGGERENTSVHSVPVGGPSVSLLSVSGATSIAAGQGERETWILTEDGTIYQRSGNGWRRSGEEQNVRAIAFPG